MNGPFSSERLRSLVPEYIQNEKDKYVAGVVETIKNMILTKSYEDSMGGSSMAPHNGNAGRFRLKVSLPMNPPKPVDNIVWKEKMSVYTPLIRAKLAELFPDMRILVDPLETYILFDWSN